MWLGHIKYGDDENGPIRRFQVNFEYFQQVNFQGVVGWVVQKLWNIKKVVKPCSRLFLSNYLLCTTVKLPPKRETFSCHSFLKTDFQPWNFLTSLIAHLLHACKRYQVTPNHTSKGDATVTSGSVIYPLLPPFVWINWNTLLTVKYHHSHLDR